MLYRTIKKVRFYFGAAFTFLVAYAIYAGTLNKASFEGKSNMFIEEVAFYQSNVGDKVLFEITPKTKIDKATANDKNNYFVEQVKKVGNDWIPVENPKKCSIDFVQYVRAPHVDTEAKREKAPPSERDKWVVQLTVKIEPKEEVNDYYKVTAKNLKTADGQAPSTEDMFVVKFNGFNKLIKR